MKILVAEDDPVSSRLLAVILKKWGHEVVTTNNGNEAWSLLQQDGAPPLAILDWLMPGLEGPEVCRRVRRNRKTSATYLILLTSLRDKEQMVAGIEAGADDYLAKPFNHNELRVRLQAAARIVELQASLAQRVTQLEAAVAERRRAEEALRNLSLTDDLTGLYNHRGFFTLAEHCLRMTRRSRQSSLLIYTDLDGLKQNNDSFGHAEGSLALVKAAEILRQTFRDSDIVARLGGDEFAVLSLNVLRSEQDKILRRLDDKVLSANETHEHAYLLSLSVGAVWIAQDDIRDIPELIEQADKLMYLQKRSKQLSAIHASGPPPSRPTLRLVS
ncbi:MAG: hypothetical protein QOD33_1731 [Pyrinomonadaceae bacterium]|nr:hypothetical protein [Pyrinomonadaceae bacterium]